MLTKCGEQAQVAELKSKVIHINKQYVEYMNSEGHATAYERRQVKNNMYKLFQALEKADFQQNDRRFEFVGPPVPPPVAQKREILPVDTEKYEPQKISGKYQEIFHLGKEYSKLHVYLENMVESTIYGARNEEYLPSSIHVKNITDSRIALHCDGPIILHNVESLVIILQCHQVRIHNMKNCQVYVNVSNDRVIIENSTNLKFSGFSGVSFCPPSFAVDDFDWPTSEAVNPHYCMVNETQDLDSKDGSSNFRHKEFLNEWISLELV